MKPVYTVSYNVVKFYTVKLQIPPPSKSLFPYIVTISISIVIIVSSPLLISRV